MTLVEFLLARIAEDEARCLTDTSFGPPTMDDPAPMRMDYDEMLVGPRRWLAECEAKRRIVELHGREHECSVYDNGEVDNCHFVIDVDECSTLCALASIYANHPEYQDEWRP